MSTRSSILAPGMHTGHRLAITLLSALAAAAPGRSMQAANAPQLALAECRLESSTEGTSVAARCGHLEVAENPAEPAGKKVQLHVAVIPALRLEPARDPLVILAGGPGQGAADFYTALSPAFSRIRRDRDVLLIDQRGTGRSNRFDCAFDEEADLAVADPAVLQEQARACLSSFDGDARFYTTSIAVRDLDAVREALGYASVNLYGVSYGTRVAQHYVRRYPAHVRSVILDGVVPVDLALGPDIAIQAQRALDAIFTRCASDARCRQRFPALRNEFRDLHTRVSVEPMQAQVSDPRTGQPTTTSLGGAQLAAAVRLLTYSDETASVLPLLIHQAQAQAQPQAMIAQYLMIRRNLESQLAYGMHFSVACSEDAPRWEVEKVTATQLQATYLGDSLMTGMRNICEVWPRGPVDEDFNAPLRSEVPALLLSGDNDPVTPAAYAQRALPAFVKGRHLHLRGQGHGQLSVGCMPRVVAKFIEQLAVPAPELECLDKVIPTPFMLSTTATAP